MKILQQGHLDGLCFLYAVANGFKAISYPGRTTTWFVNNQHAVWQKLVSVTPSLYNFASGLGSTFGGYSSDTEARLKGLLLDSYANILSDKKHNKFCVKKISIDNIHDSISSTSVVLNCLRPETETLKGTMGNHWVCVVDADDKFLYLACSYSGYFVDKNNESTEGISPNFDRPYNNRMAKDRVKKATIFETEIYSLRMESSAKK